MVAALLLGSLRTERQSWWGLGIILTSAFVVASNDPRHDVGELVFTPLLFAVLWVTGHAIRQRIVEAETAERRAVQAEHEREDIERRAVPRERARIAREMHDVVGHNVSVMTVQASAVRRLLTESQTRERAALLAVEETGREALTEMRRVVTVLRDPTEDLVLTPPPGLSQLPRLLDHARSSGLPVDLTIEGRPARLPAGVDLAAYRVRESLTNAIRHAGATLVTSRSPLHLSGEQEFPVPPMSVPEPGPVRSVAPVAASESAQLFAARAVASVPGFAIDERNAGAIAAIVQRLEGLPLAIELAAARVKLLPRLRRSWSGWRTR